MRKWRNCTLLHSVRSLQSGDFWTFPRASSWSAGRLRHEPFDEGSARILHAGSPRHSGKSAKSASRVLAGTTGNMAHCPWGWDHAMAEDAEVHSGGTDVVSTSSTQLVYTVYGVVELLLDRLWSLCSPLTPQGVEGRWQWSSLVAVLGTAQHAQPAALTAFLDRYLPQFLPFGLSF